MNESPVSRLEKSRLQFNTSVARIFLHCIDHNQKERHESRVSFALRINFTSLERRKKGSLNSFSSSTTVQDGKDSVTSFMTALLQTSQDQFSSALNQVLFKWTKKGIIAHSAVFENYQKCRTKIDPPDKILIFPAKIQMTMISWGDF